MSITIAGTTFEDHHYDQRGDVLYLSVAHYEGPPAKASSTPEGHNIEYDATGRVVGILSRTCPGCSIAMGRSPSPFPPATSARTI
jgi:Protein of unknown function (DUF2283)